MDNRNTFWVNHRTVRTGEATSEGRSAREDDGAPHNPARSCPRQEAQQGQSVAKIGVVPCRSS